MIRTKEQMYDDIRNWEYEHGESFLDYFGARLNEWNFMFWCQGKGYITEDQLESFEIDNPSGTEYWYGDEEYSVVQEEDDSNDWQVGYEKAFRILAEFLSLTETYQRRVDEFLQNISRISIKDVVVYPRIENIFYIKDEERIYLDKNYNNFPSFLEARSIQFYVDGDK